MTNKSSKHIKNNSKHYNKSNLIVAFIIVFIFVVILFIKGKNKVAPIIYNDIQIILNNENITSNMEDKVLNENDKIYMSVEDIQKFLDNTIYFEKEIETYITTSSKKLATLKENSDSITINGSNLKVDNMVINKEGKKYFAISEMENIYDYEFAFITDTNIVTIDSLKLKQERANIKKATELKEKNETFSKKIKKLQKEEEVILIKEEGNQTKIRAQDGRIGYVKTDLLTNRNITREDFIENNKEKNDVEDYFEYDLSEKDITTFEKRQNIINLILQQTIKNDKMYVKIIYNKEENNDFNRFKIETKPILQECGITVLL